MKVVLDATTTTAPSDSSYAGSLLRSTAAALSERRNERARRFVHELPVAHYNEGPIDRLLVGLIPQLKPSMMAHYENGAPPLGELWTSEQIQCVDVILAGIVPQLNHFYTRAMRLEQSEGAVIREIVEQQMASIRLSVALAAR